jgi:hypothetical protein
MRRREAPDHDDRCEGGGEEGCRGSRRKGREERRRERPRSWRGPCPGSGLEKVAGGPHGRPAEQRGDPVPPVRRRRLRRASAGAPASPGALPGFGGDGADPARGHAEPGHDRGTRGGGAGGVGHDRPPPALRPLPCAHRLPVRRSPVGLRLAPGTLPLVRNAPAVRGLRHHAVRSPPAGRRPRRAHVGRDGGAALAFLLVGAGAHTVQTAGLALATDLANPEQRPGSWRFSTSSCWRE